MKNIEKYPNTKDALEAYELRDNGITTFHEWCDAEYKKPKPLTLLEALRTARAILKPIPLTAFQLAGYKKIVQAIEAEETRPETNYERFGTAEKAMQYFVKHCRNKDYCRFCPLRSVHDIDSVGWISCFARWLYSTEDVFQKEENNEEAK